MKNTNKEVSAPIGNQRFLTSEDIPDVLYDKDGNKFVVLKPGTPDVDFWVRVFPEEKK